MLEGAGARLWGSILAGAIAFPVATILLLAGWVIRVQIVGPPVDPSPVTAAVARPHSQQKAEAAVPPQRRAVTEAVAPSTTASAPAREPSSAAPVPDNAPPAEADRVQAAVSQDPPPQAAVTQDTSPQDASPSVPALAAVEPAAVEPAAPKPAEPDAGGASKVEAADHPPLETVHERFAPALETTKAPDFTPALSVFATLSAVPPKLGTAYADPNQEASPATAAAAHQLVPLPRPKPRVAATVGVAPSATAAGVNRAPSPRPVGSNPPPRTAPSPR